MLSHLSQLSEAQPLTPAALRLQHAALLRFEKQGFTATSLAEIAADAGIKKPSIYAHFKSKEALFLSLVAPAIGQQLDYARKKLCSGDDLRESLLHFMKDIRVRYETTPQMRFWLRTFFLPPAALHDVILDALHIYMAEMENIIRQAFAGSSLLNPEHGLNADVLASAYLGILDTIQAELLYGGALKFERRCASMWKVFDLALKGCNHPQSPFE